MIFLFRLAARSTQFCRIAIIDCGALIRASVRRSIGCTKSPLFALGGVLNRPTEQVQNAQNRVQA